MSVNGTDVTLQVFSAIEALSAMLYFADIAPCGRRLLLYARSRCGGHSPSTALLCQVRDRNRENSS